MLPHLASSLRGQNLIMLLVTTGRLPRAVSSVLLLSLSLPSLPSLPPPPFAGLPCIVSLTRAGVPGAWLALAGRLAGVLGAPGVPGAMGAAGVPGAGPCSLSACAACGPLLGVAGVPGAMLPLPLLRLLLVPTASFLQVGQMTS